MSMYNLIGHNNNYEKTLESLWQWRKNDPNDGQQTESESFKLTSKLTTNANKAGIADIEIAVPLKCLSNFWKTIGQ